MATRQLRVTITGDASRLRRAFDHADRSTARFSTRLGSFGGVAVRAIGGATVALGGLAAAGTVLGLKTAANLETAEVAFTKLLGSGRRARKFLGDLKSFAARTPFELPGLVDASRALVGAGTAASDVIPTLTALGDASGALGLDQERFGRVMLAVTQIMNRGKVQAEELNQITEAGIPVWQLLAKATGKPVPELQKLMQSGKLLAEDTLPLLFEQMQKDYGGGMEQQAKTLNGVWSTFKDTIAIALSDALQPLIPILKENLPKAAESFRLAVENLTGWVKENKDAIRLLGEVLKGIFIPQAKGANDASLTLADTLSFLLTAVLRGVQAWLLLERVLAGVVAMVGVNLEAFGLLLNAILFFNPALRGSGDKFVAWGRELRDVSRRDLAGIERDARNAQRAIDAMHGKTLRFTSVWTTIGSAGTSMHRIVGQHGGIVRRPTMALIGEAGPEAVVPLHRSPGNRPLPAGGMGGPVVLRIESGGSRMDDLLVEVLKKAVRTRGGDVQVVLGQG